MIDKDLMNEFLNLKNQIDDTSTVVTEQERLAKEYPECFGLELCALFNRNTLEHKIEKCKTIHEQLMEEVFEYRLVGDGIDYGSAPLELIGSFLTNLQKTFYRLAQEISDSVSPQISATVASQTRLRINAFASGSFKIVCNGIKPDSGVFSSDPEIADDNLLTKSAEKLFTIFSDISEEDLFKQEVDDLSPFTVAALKDLLGVVSKNGVSLEASWLRKDKTVKSDLRNEVVSSRFNYLGKIEIEPKKDEICLKGNLLELNRDKNTFLFKTKNEGKIKVAFEEDAVDQMKEHGFNPLDYKTEYIINLVKVCYKTVSGKDKVNYTFVGFSSEESLNVTPSSL